MAKNSINNRNILTVISELWSETQKKSLVKVSGISMQPLLPGGESIVVDHANKDLKFGDIGVFNRDGVMIVHRVLFRKKVGEKIFYRTKGDWMLFMDTPSESNLVIGKVTFATIKGKEYNLNAFGSKIYSRIMALYSILIALDGKVALMLDQCMNSLTGRHSKTKEKKEFRFFRNFFIRIDRFFQRFFHRIFFSMFNKAKN